jgi:hypothetical protein
MHRKEFRQLHGRHRNVYVDGIVISMHVAKRFSKPVLLLRVNLLGLFGQ